ncbi:MAG: MarR family transcriptional regulator [Lachnospiraceae bacterium]|nr:MarR family transcriptional regulator [Lachnospiraceae bacterium]
MDYQKLAEELMANRIAIDRHPREEHVKQVFRGEIQVIRYLMEFCDHASPGELSEYSEVSTARMASTLKSLEKKGFVRRSADPEDGRKIIVRLTPMGEAYGMERRQEVLRDLTELLMELGEKDAAEYTRICRKIRDFCLKKREMKEKKGCVKEC